MLVNFHLKNAVCLETLNVAVVSNLEKDLFLTTNIVNVYFVVLSLEAVSSTDDSNM